MTDHAKRLADAERDAAAARERLSATVAVLQTRLNPRTLARSTAEDFAERGTEIAKAGVEGARRNPVMVLGTALLAGLFIARTPIAKAVRGRKHKR